MVSLRKVYSCECTSRANLPEGMQILESGIASQGRKMAAQGTIIVQSSRIPSIEHRVRDLTLSLGGYIRRIVSVNYSKSTWTLDPRLDIGKTFGGVGTPGGVGNQVSCEFNLLYYFYSGVSKRDDTWTRDFFRKFFPGQAPTFENTIPKEPEKWTFGGLNRTSADGTGTFNNDDLVKILKESIKGPAADWIFVVTGRYWVARRGLI
ncbi:hypothetical protein B9Z19DRAFT_1110262 [Tuber borchii]|uniref:Uncharacterized protein n=1 Tax=Tuber borchii TaxID=42251 RepID=A0A2T6ZI13_TUBBO|nr:hypothetical protein B9Z19DRAFT_1110262 [Tuber borchii]